MISSGEESPDALRESAGGFARKEKGKSRKFRLQNNTSETVNWF